MRELVTTLLDTLGLLLLAAGATAAAWEVIGPAGFAAGGVVVLAGVRWADRAPRKPKGEAG